MTETKKITGSNAIWISVTLTALFVLLFLATRLTNITTFPLFLDETTHIYLADLTLTGDIFAGLRETHKQIYIWAISFFLLFINDPLLAGRLVSVLAGLITSAICYTLAEQLYPGRRIGYLAALFYLISPFSVLYDRMAMADSTQTLLMSASLLASVKLWRRGSAGWAVITGITFGAATFNKGYAALFYPAPVLAWLFLGKNIGWKKIITLLSITFAVASVAWISLLGIGWDIYLRDLQEKSIANSAAFESDFLARLWISTGWLGAYLTWSMAGLLIFTIVMIVIKQDRAGMFLITLIVAYVVILTFFFAEMRPRYLMPLLPPVSVIIARGIEYLAQLISQFINTLPGAKNFPPVPSRAFQITLFLAFAVAPATFSFLIVTNPDQAPLPHAEKIDYLIQAQSPQGHRELAQLIAEQIQESGKLILLQHSLPSPQEVILSAYLPQEIERKMEIVPITAIEQISPQALNKYAVQAPTFTAENGFIWSNAQNPNAYAQLQQVASFSRHTSHLPNGNGMYQWLLPPDFIIQWLVRGGKVAPKVAWDAAGSPTIPAKGELVDWPSTAATSLEEMQQTLTAANIEYVLVTPGLINRRAKQLSLFFTADDTKLSINKIPPAWRLAYIYPGPHCEWCLFQLSPPNHPAEAGYNSTIKLEGFDISANRLSAGKQLHLTLYWHSLAQVDESYAVFIHLMDEKGQLVAQVDELPLKGQWPTNTWQAGDRLADRHTLKIPPNLPAGDYSIVVGLYNPQTLTRLPAQSSQHPVANNAATLTLISVEPLH